MLWCKYFGDLFTWAFYGLLIVQGVYHRRTLHTTQRAQVSPTAYFYYINYPDDKKWTRFLVLALFLIETAST